MRPITPQQNTKMRLRMRLLAAVLAVGCLGGLTVRLFVLMLRDPGGYAARAADQQLRGATLPAARGEISPKLPMGVGHKTSFPVEVFMGAIIPPDSACANDAAKAQKRLGQNARSSQALCAQVRLCASDQGLSSKAS